MYKLTPFNKRICSLMRQYFGILLDDCDEFTIWRFCPEMRLSKLREFFFSCSLCQPRFFSYIYWLVLLVSLMGGYYSFNEFTNIYLNKQKYLNMWRDRRIMVIPYSYLLKGRLAGSFIWFLTWIMLVYGVLFASPICMTPWMAINMLTIAFDFISFVCQVLLGRAVLESSVMVSFALSIITQMCVQCVRYAFDNSIQDADLSLMKALYSST